MSYIGNDPKVSVTPGNTVALTNKTIDAASNTLTGVAKLATAQTFTATQTPYRATATASVGANTWTLTSGQVYELTFGAGNITLSVSGGVAGTFYTLYLKQDATGGRTAGWTGFKFAAGVTPTLSTAASAIDIFTFYYDGTSMCCVGKAQGLA